MYRIFSRTWWKENRDWPNGLEPCPGRRHYTGQSYNSDNEARAECRRLNAELEKVMTAKQRRLGLKYEYGSD